MKEQLLNLARDKGFNSIFSVGIHVNELGWLFWLVELQKWLREVHNLHIRIWYNFLTDKWRVEYIADIKQNVLNSGNEDEFATYELALEQGLQEALKLIK